SMCSFRGKLGSAALIKVVQAENPKGGDGNRLIDITAKKIGRDRFSLAHPIFKLGGIGFAIPPKEYARLGEPLRRQLADPSGPVGERGPRTRRVRRAGRYRAVRREDHRPACAGTEQVVSGAAKEERTAEVGVAARMGNVFAGDPDGIPVNCRSAVVTPARADRVRKALLLVAGEAVVVGSSSATRE